MHKLTLIPLIATVLHGHMIKR